MSNRVPMMNKLMRQTCGYASRRSRLAELRVQMMLVVAVDGYCDESATLRRRW